MSNSCNPMEPARLLCQWDSPGKNTGVGCHFILPGDFLNPGIEPRSPALQVDSLPTELQGKLSISTLLLIISFVLLTLFFFLLILLDDKLFEIFLLWKENYFLRKDCITMKFLLKTAFAAFHRFVKLHYHFCLSQDIFGFLL